jgi:long-chain fatty acid transport protein
MLAVLAVALLVPAAALVTNGDNLIGVGPISRAMGGVGIAHPRDAISAGFSNPAAMCCGDFCHSPG